MLQPTKIKKHNEVISNPYEMTQLKSRRHLTDRTLHLECPNFPIMDAATAKLIAVYRLSDAAIGGCGRILVKGPRWQYEFDTKRLNNAIRRKWGRRSGVVESPFETKVMGSYYDETRQLWQVPAGFNKRETITFPAV